jgi:hypothetical protein
VLAGEVSDLDTARRREVAGPVRPAAVQGADLDPGALADM